MAAEASWASVISTFIGGGGLALGLALLLFGFYVAKRGATTSVAIAMFGAAALIPVGAFVAIFFGMIGAFDDVVRQGPNVTPSDLSSGMLASFGVAGLSLLGLVLGLIGAFRALVAARAHDSRQAGALPRGA
jgi:hypothetical protein